MKKKIFNGNLNSKSAKNYYLEKVKEIAERLTNQDFKRDGAYIVSVDGIYVINVSDYVYEYYEHELDNQLSNYVEKIIKECEG